MQALIKEYGHKRLQDLDSHKRKRLIERMERKRTEEEVIQKSPVHKIVNSSAELMRNMVRLNLPDKDESDYLTNLDVVPNNTGGTMMNARHDNLSAKSLLQKLMHLGYDHNCLHRMAVEKFKDEEPVASKPHPENDIYGSAPDVCRTGPRLALSSQAKAHSVVELKPLLGTASDKMDCDTGKGAFNSIREFLTRKDSRNTAQEHCPPDHPVTDLPRERASAETELFRSLTQSPEQVLISMDTEESDLDTPGELEQAHHPLLSSHSSEDDASSEDSPIHEKNPTSSSSSLNPHLDIDSKKCSNGRTFSDKVSTCLHSTNNPGKPRLLVQSKSHSIPATADVSFPKKPFLRKTKSDSLSFARRRSASSDCQPANVPLPQTRCKSVFYR